MHLYEWKVLCFDLNFTEVWSYQGLSSQQISNGSCNGLAPVQRQAITWTTAELKQHDNPMCAAYVASMAVIFYHILFLYEQ